MRFRKDEIGRMFLLVVALSIVYVTSREISSIVGANLNQVKELKSAMENLQ